MSNHSQESLNCEATLIGQKFPDCEATIVGDESSSQQLSASTNLNPNETQPQTVVTLVNKFLAKAVEKQATHLEIEPEANFLSIRYRHKNILKPLIDPLPNKLTSAILSRLKQMAELDINSSQTPQKGRIRKRGGGRTIHFFVQTKPSFYGEKMTIRVVDSAVKPPTLENLIPDVLIRESLEEILKYSSGLLLVTSTEKQVPTSLLYSLFSTNISNPTEMASVEQSISYLLSGMSQIEIDVDREKDYPEVLQSLLEQEKSRIMVDRLSNPSVARMAAEMANNNRFVLTSLSAEDGISAITLLREMVTPGLLADNLIGVVHQYSLPRLCPACRTVHEVSTGELAQWGISQENKGENLFYQARSLNEIEIDQMREKGRLCRQCNGEGYDGQVHLYEFHPITPDLKTAIAEGANLDQLKQVSLQSQQSSLIATGLELVKEGKISLTDLQRLSPDSSNLSTPSETITPLPTEVTQRVEKMETLLMTLTEELYQLKQSLKPEVSSTKPIKTASSLEPSLHISSLDEVSQATQINEQINSHIDLSKETITADSNLYEELQDPGDWEALKQELDPSKETMVTTDLPYNEETTGNPFKSIPDPWS
ncbi:GspE/PulE family protein [Crocosphaera chwakensis]|uniref:General secretion pathway protein E n=1 Tax=Crocosphaera chwakensis CCY0110 TaxID=391612 RepID=A3ITJ9_9CHRO|nr:ATPase, T2SS/T4P/T4SS family [Crocosphaera chwakensis]EAZ90180.1 general secretion pathway protein E [Crocosphaera chwakensis CCY0110]